ncbi:AB hydrolase superfamily protein [Pleurotus pulmonarius]
MANLHLHDELQNSARVVVETRYGPVIGARSVNGAAVFLEVPYALPPKRFQDPEPLPTHFRYDTKEHVEEASYAVQPRNDGQAKGTPFEDKVGFGKPTENPLFLNIVAPPAFPSGKKYPVRVYIHGGFLQFGSPHSLSSQAQYVAAERSEVWVNIGYRLSAFGFLACDNPKVDGNFGFKDQWLALEFIKDNISTWEGDPNDIRITGLSAGAHSVHQILHHASRLPAGHNPPFNSAVLQSNAILTNPRTPSELRPQYRALCEALGLDPDDPNTLATLRDPGQTPWSSITRVIETDALGTEFGTFRGCVDGKWLAGSPDPMSWQRSGGLAQGLREKGVKSIIIGDLTEEWYLYSIAHPVARVEDIVPNLERYFSKDLVSRMIQLRRGLPSNASPSEVQKLFGEILSNLQVYLPVRLFARDFMKAGFPILRYEIQWTPEQNRPEGYVTHGTDRSIWALRLPVLEKNQADIARGWLDAIAKETRDVEHGIRPDSVAKVLILGKDGSSHWGHDGKWEDVIRLVEALDDNI